ncbi:MAG TPA: 6-carboxytetrahydropterin synthase [Nitrososphaeraceae archaeon]|nr:6-carboxytetrahydropterin synthase [Nitrososphaeraceae archaeon]
MYSVTDTDIEDIILYAYNNLYAKVIFVFVGNFMKGVVTDSDLKYIDQRGNLLRNRSELSTSNILSFLGHNYEYNVRVDLSESNFVYVDFKVDDKYIEVIDSESDIEKFKMLKRSLPKLNVIGIGHSNYAAKISELESFFSFDFLSDHVGSVFIEDPSLAFDYAHILPLVEKCSILHGHTSTVMVEIIGNMKDNLVIDFGKAKRIIKDTLNALDHKFFINKQYLESEDSVHYHISFEGPKGYFNLQLPKTTTFLLPGEATIENISSQIIKLLAPKMPANVEALGVYVYEGVNKGAHIIAETKPGKL